MTDFETWLHDFGYGNIFRMYELRKPGQFTPYEVEREYIDQPLLYINDNYINIMIVNTIELPDKDILIGYKEIYDKEDILTEDEKSIIHYKRFSNIELSYHPEDQNYDNYE